MDGWMNGWTDGQNFSPFYRTYMTLSHQRSRARVPLTSCCLLAFYFFFFRFFPVEFARQCETHLVMWDRDWIHFFTIIQPTTLALNFGDLEFHVCDVDVKCACGSAGWPVHPTR